MEIRLTALALKATAFRLPAALREHKRALAVLAVMVALWVVAAMSVTTQISAPQQELREGNVAPNVRARLAQAAEATSATELQQISADNALAINASIPVASLANPAARPFVTAFADAANRARSLDCLTAAIYYEAATEPTDGQRAVAQVVLNRVRHPAYPNTVCGVVFEGAHRSTGCQFSFTCDGSLRRAPMAGYWDRARQVAEAALNGYVYAPVGWATHYHANYVVPYWSSTLVKSANVGLHIFYRWRGGWGRPAAFISHYAGNEPAIAWRGGFGQPLPSEIQTVAGARDAAAAEAAAAAAPSASVDSFQRAVLRRYEPIQPANANAMISARTRADPSLSASQRWALTGEGNGPAQPAFGRRSDAPAPPPQLEGVHYRSQPAATAPAQPAHNESTSSAGSDASATESVSR
jgi:spore germination cell wall hydrolase CwlJ-like protein